jgi:hypothetical protein
MSRLIQSIFVLYFRKTHNSSFEEKQEICYSTKARDSLMQMRGNSYLNVVEITQQKLDKQNPHLLCK